MRFSVILLFLQLGNVKVSLSQYACSTPPDVPHAHISEETKKTVYQGGDVIHFTCEPGYASSSPTIRYFCSSEGWLAIQKDACLSMGCSRPPVDGGITVTGLPENVEPIRPGRLITFMCDGAGNYLNGSAVLICGEDGHWNNSFPSCGEQCKVTGVPDGVRLKTRVTNNQVRKGQKLRFECTNYRDTLRGNSEVECLADGQWSDPFPTCGDPLECGKPPFLADGDTKLTVRFKYRHGQRVEYICQNYYTMEGEPYKTCNNGDWIGEMKCLKPCTVDREAMDTHNIASKHRYDDKLYSAHNDEIHFRCTRRMRPVDPNGMRQRCVDGVMHLPSCQ